MWDCTQSLPMLLENKTVRAWLPKADKQACEWPGTKSSPIKRRFWGTVPIKSIVRFGKRVGLAWPCSTPYDTCTVLLPMKGTPLPLLHMCSSGTLMLVPSTYCVVVVHSCLYRALIKHEWGASLADVGLHSKSSHVAWEQNRAGLAPQSGHTSLRVARNKILPHIYIYIYIYITFVIIPIINENMIINYITIN